MGRKSKLSDAQWADIGRRLLEGEGSTELAREYGVKESTIRSHFDRKGEGAPKVRVAAQLLVQADAALSALPPAAQVSAMNLAAKLRNISEKVASTVEISACTSLGLASLANSEFSKIDDAEPVTKSKKRLEAVMTLQRASNEALAPALNLLSANRDTVKRIHEEPLPAEGEIVTPERIKEGARRIAFTLHRAAALETS